MFRKKYVSYVYIYIYIYIFGIHTASTPITSGTHTDGGAVTRKPGSAWLEGTPAKNIIFMFFTQICKQKMNRTKHT